MYSVVLATMMATTPAAPDWHCYHGCYAPVAVYSCCGCCGYYSSCYGCCGYYSGCYGCCGYYYSSCYGCCGCYGYSCWGCYGSYCSGCYGGVLYSYYPSCYGSVLVPPPPVKVAPEKPKLPKPMDDKKKEEVSTVTIKAPTDVRLTVDGQPLAMRGTTQTFETPNLERGHTYTYVFRVEAKREGKSVTGERKVQVRAGESTEVDFSDLSAKAPARVTIVMPADAKLIVEDVAFPAGASKRTFETPALEAGHSYSYTMRAEVMRDGRLQKQVKRVDIEAGQEVTVEFKELPALQAAQR